MLDLDIKSMVIGGVLTVAVGGGLYGIYMKTLFPAAVTQVKTEGLIHECASLLGSNNLFEIEEFLHKVKERSEDIEESDAVVTGVAISVGQSYEKSAGMGKPLLMCTQELASRKKSLRN